jgi:hypothetical protein
VVSVLEYRSARGGVRFADRRVLTLYIKISRVSHQLAILCTLSSHHLRRIVSFWTSELPRRDPERLYVVYPFVMMW